jgi:hypothetical protein
MIQARMRRSPPGKPLRTSLRVQSGYYVATCVWPLLNRQSFEAITGRKVDFWLVQTVLSRASRTSTTRSILSALSGTCHKVFP